jgi:hypothetical protein
MKPDIQTNFHNGRRARAESPLPFGLYKLIEVRRYPDRIIDTLDDLMKAKRHKQPIAYVLFGDSPRTWARNWLKELAYRVGKDLLPSIEALTGDGISDDVIQQNLPLLRPMESELLATIERADWQIKSWGIDYEYERWTRGDSALIDPCAKFLEITEIGLRLVDEHLPDRLSAREREEFFRPHPNLFAC